MNTKEKVYCGVDVSKKYLDAYLGRKTVRFDNSLEGVVELMKKAGEVHFVFESTGGYERVAAWFLLGKGRQASIVNPVALRSKMVLLGILWQEGVSSRVERFPPKNGREASPSSNRTCGFPASGFPCCFFFGLSK